MIIAYCWSSQVLQSLHLTLSDNITKHVNVRVQIHHLHLDWLNDQTRIVTTIVVEACKLTLQLCWLQCKTRATCKHTLKLMGDVYVIQIKSTQ